MINNSTNLKYHDLMLHRINEILLVSSPYDSFILEEDGNLSEQILHEFQGMNLSYAPRIWSAHTGKDALDLLNTRNFDLIIIMLRIADTNPLIFSKNMNTELLNNLKRLKKDLVLLSEERKVVLSHHKTFEHVEKMRELVKNSIELIENE